MGCNASKKVSSQVEEVVITTDDNEDHHHHLGRVVVCVGPFDGPTMISLSEDNDYDNDNGNDNDNETNNAHGNHYFNEVSALDLEYDDDDDDNETEDMTATITSHLTSLVQYDKTNSVNNNGNDNHVNEQRRQQLLRTLSRRPSFKKFKGKIILPPKLCRTKNGNNVPKQQKQQQQHQQQYRGRAGTMHSRSIHDVLKIEGDNNCTHLLQMNLSSRSFRICQ